MTFPPLFQRVQETTTVKLLFLLSKQTHFTTVVMIKMKINGQMGTFDVDMKHLDLQKNSEDRITKEPQTYATNDLLCAETSRQ